MGIFWHNLFDDLLLLKLLMSRDFYAWSFPFRHIPQVGTFDHIHFSNSIFSNSVVIKCVKNCIFGMVGANSYKNGTSVRALLSFRWTVYICQQVHHAICYFSRRQFICRTYINSDWLQHPLQVKEISILELAWRVIYTVFFLQCLYLQREQQCCVWRHMTVTTNCI